MKPNFQIITIEELKQNLSQYGDDLNSFWILVDRIEQQPKQTIHSDINNDQF